MRVSESITKSITIRWPAVAALGVHWALPLGLILAVLFWGAGLKVPHMRVSSYSSSSELTLVGVFLLVFSISLGWQVQVARRQASLPFFTGIKNYANFCWFWVTLLVLNSGAASFAYAYVTRGDVTDVAFKEMIPVMMLGGVWVSLIGLLIYSFAVIRLAGAIWVLSGLVVVGIVALFAYGYEGTWTDYFLLVLGFACVGVTVFGVIRRTKGGVVKHCFGLLWGLSLLVFVVVEDAVPGARNGMDSVYQKVSNKGLTLSVSMVTAGGRSLTDIPMYNDRSLTGRSMDDGRLVTEMPIYDDGHDGNYYADWIYQANLRGADGAPIRVTEVTRDLLEGLVAVSCEDAEEGMSYPLKTMGPFLTNEEGVWKLSPLVLEYYYLKADVFSHVFDHDGFNFNLREDVGFDFDDYASGISNFVVRSAVVESGVVSVEDLDRAEAVMDELGLSLYVFFERDLFHINRSDYREGAYMLTFWLMGLGVLAQFLLAPIFLFLFNRIRAMPE